MVHAQCHIASSVTAKPGHLRIGSSHIAHWRPVAGTELSIKPVVANAVGKAGAVAELHIVEAIVVAEHDFGPRVAKQVYIAQINHVVVVAVDVVAVVIQVVERGVIESTEVYPDDAVDDGGTCIRTETRRN